jgi:twinkle protein
MSEFRIHEPCTECGSKNNLARYSDGHAHCFGCGHWEPPTDTENYTYKEENNNMTAVQTKGFIGAIPERNISKKITNKYGVRISHGEDGRVNKHYYPYYSNKTSDLVGYKERVVEDKSFIFSGTNRGAGLFGQNIARGNSTHLTITEGELDALSISEMFDGKWDVVSLKNGASGAARDIKENLEFIESYDNVVLCFDNDEAGQEALKAVRDIISPNKLKICKLPMKDANDMLVNGRLKDFTDAWWGAKPYTPDGIISAMDTWEYLEESKDIKSIPYPWQGLNEYTYGFRQAELVTITSGSGMGKSSLVKELEHYLLNTTEDGVAVIHLEESIAGTTKGLMSVEYNEPLHLPGHRDNYTDEEWHDMWFKAVGSKQERLFLLNHFGSISEDSLISRIRSLAKGLDCKWIILDHLSIVVSDQEGFTDERKAIDAIMTKLRKIVQETGIGLFLVSHLKRPMGKAHEEGGQVSLSELRGSAAIAQLSDMVIGLERNQQAEDKTDRNTTTLRVIKNRFSGLTGKCCELVYNETTGRLREGADGESLF